MVDLIAAAIEIIDSFSIMKLELHVRARLSEREREKCVSMTLCHDLRVLGERTAAAPKKRAKRSNTAHGECVQEVAQKHTTQESDRDSHTTSLLA